MGSNCDSDSGYVSRRVILNRRIVTNDLTNCVLASINCKVSLLHCLHSVSFKEENISSYPTLVDLLHRLYLHIRRRNGLSI